MSSGTGVPPDADHKFGETLRSHHIASASYAEDGDSAGRMPEPLTRSNLCLKVAASSWSLIPYGGNF